MGKEMGWTRHVANGLGLLFIAASLVAFVTSFVPAVRIDPWLHITAAIASFAFGYLLLQHTVAERSVVRILAERASETGDPLAAWEKVREKSGILGFLRTVNITGLPLATILVTLVFCAFAILSYIVNAMATGSAEGGGVIPTEFPESVLELAKLTLGAFIGSFVTRASERT